MKPCRSITALLLVASALFAPACGVKGPPLPPIASVPNRSDAWSKPAPQSGTSPRPRGAGASEEEGGIR